MTVDLFDFAARSHPERADSTPVSLGDGAVLLPGLACPISPALLDAVRHIAAEAPFQHLLTPNGGQMSVAMTACGLWGWHSDRAGYRYTQSRPDTGTPWPAMPEAFTALTTRAAHMAGFEQAPVQSCLINRYSPGTKLSLHQDRDEKNALAPIVSVSLGIPATFLWGGLARRDPVRKIRLTHGDVVVWGGPSRFVFHGIAPIRPSFHPETGEYRFNITFRQITA